MSQDLEFRCADVSSTWAFYSVWHVDCSHHWTSPLRSKPASLPTSLWGAGWWGLSMAVSGRNRSCRRGSFFTFSSALDLSPGESTCAVPILPVPIASATTISLVQPVASPGSSSCSQSQPPSGFSTRQPVRSRHGPACALWGLHCPRMTHLPPVDKALLLLFSVISHHSSLTPPRSVPWAYFSSWDECLRLFLASKPCLKAPSLRRVHMDTQDRHRLPPSISPSWFLRGVPASFGSHITLQVPSWDTKHTVW